MIDVQKDYLLGRLEKANTGCVVVVKTETEWWWCNYVVQNSAFLMKCLWLCGTCTCENNIHYHHLHLPPFKQNTKLDSQKFESSDCVAFAGLHKKGWEFVLGIEC